MHFLSISRKWYIVKINIQQLLPDHSAKKHTRKHYSSNNYLFIFAFVLIIDRCQIQIKYGKK